MSTKSRPRRGGWFSFFRSPTKPANPHSKLLGDSEFSHVVDKERCRSERRDLSFCIAVFDFGSPDFVNKEGIFLEELCRRFRERLRITDEIGIFRGQFAVLLAETIPHQAAKVVNDLEDISADMGQQVSTDIIAYPESGNPDPANHSGVDDESTSNSYAQGPRRDDDTSSPIKSEMEHAQSNVAVAEKPPMKLQEVQRQGRNKRAQRLRTLLPTPYWKRVLDVIGASFGLIVLSPIFLLTSIIIRLDSKGSALFSQWREGKDGQLFKIYKFRTMRVGADDEKAAFRAESEQDGPAFKMKDDPRLTRVGKYLRKSCIDELPQLINVLKGEMSLVGPRPLPVDESLNCSHWHRRRLDVLPGMTCIWQVDGGRDTAFDDWMRMDLEYIGRRSLIFDLWLLVKTVKVTLLHRGSV